MTESWVASLCCMGILRWPDNAGRQPPQIESLKTLSEPRTDQMWTPDTENDPGLWQNSGTFLEMGVSLCRNTHLEGWEPKNNPQNVDMELELPEPPSWTFEASQICSEVSGLRLVSTFHFYSVWGNTSNRIPFPCVEQRPVLSLLNEEGSLFPVLPETHHPEKGWGRGTIRREGGKMDGVAWWYYFHHTFVQDATFPCLLEMGEPVSKWREVGKMLKLADFWQVEPSTIPLKLTLQWWSHIRWVRGSLSLEPVSLSRMFHRSLKPRELHCMGSLSHLQSTKLSLVCRSVDA